MYLFHSGNEYIIHKRNSKYTISNKYLSVLIKKLKIANARSIIIYKMCKISIKILTFFIKVRDLLLFCDQYIVLSHWLWHYPMLCSLSVTNKVFKQDWGTGWKKQRHMNISHDIVLQSCLHSHFRICFYLGENVRTVFGLVGNLVSFFLKITIYRSNGIQLVLPLILLVWTHFALLEYFNF